VSVLDDLLGVDDLLEVWDRYSVEKVAILARF